MKNKEPKKEKSLIEPLYMTPEFQAGYEAGLEKARSEKTPKPKIIEKVIIRPRKEHIHQSGKSQRLRWGVVSKCKLLNPTFNTEQEAAIFMANLTPANRKNLDHVSIDALVVDLGKN